MKRMSEGFIRPDVLGRVIKECGRPFRPRQKGVACSIEGCDNWCVSNDLCSKHNMARHRLTEKGRAYVKKYNERYKQPDIKKACIECGGGFVTAKKSQELCSECSPKVGAYIATKKYRVGKGLVK